MWVGYRSLLWNEHSGVGGWGTHVTGSTYTLGHLHILWAVWEAITNNWENSERLSTLFQAGQDFSGSGLAVAFKKEFDSDEIVCHLLSATHLNATTCKWDKGLERCAIQLTLIPTIGPAAKSVLMLKEQLQVTVYINHPIFSLFLFSSFAYNSSKKIRPTIRKVD